MPEKREGDAQGGVTQRTESDGRTIQRRPEPEPQTRSRPVQQSTIPTVPTQSTASAASPDAAPRGEDTEMDDLTASFGAVLEFVPRGVRRREKRRGKEVMEGT